MTTTYVALLRAVNVGSTGKLPMADLRALCEGAGFARVRTYIASGNVILSSDATAATVKAKLEAALVARAGQAIGVHVRTGAEMADVLMRNPFPKAPPQQVAVIFLDEPPDPDTVSAAQGRTDEAITLGRREIYVHYPSGMGSSKMKLPAAKKGTARNINTVAKLAEMAAVA